MTILPSQGSPDQTSIVHPYPHLNDFLSTMICVTCFGRYSSICIIRKPKSRPLNFSIITVLSLDIALILVCWGMFNKIVKYFREIRLNESKTWENKITENCKSKNYKNQIQYLTWFISSVWSDNPWTNKREREREREREIITHKNWTSLESSNKTSTPPLTFQGR